MCKTISLEKLNSLLANIKADRTVKQYNDANPDKAEPRACEHKIHLAKVVSRTDLFKNKAGVPFYAFVKKVGSLVVLVDLVTGSAQIVAASVIASESDVKDNFRVNGVTYGVKDSVNGFKRYRPLSYEPKKPRRKLKVSEAYEEMRQEEAVEDLFPEPENNAWW